MSVTNVTPPIKTYTATAGQTVFGIPFPFLDDTHIVGLKTPAAGGAPVPLVLTTDYTLTGAGTANGGEATLTSGATVGDFYTWYRVTPPLRGTDFPFTGPIPTAMLNGDLDRLVLILQEFARDAILGGVLPSDGPLGQSLPAITSGTALRIPRINLGETAWELVGPLGTAAFLNGGTAASELPQLDGTGKLPPVDGSQLTNLPAPPDATQSVKGLIEIASQAETDAGASGTLAVTPLMLAGANKNLFDRTNGIWVFTSSGTWTHPGGSLVEVEVEVIGAGGGGRTGTTSAAGPGGGGGGRSRKVVDVSDGLNVTVTVGAAGTSGGSPTAGGTSSFGAHCSATGGQPAGAVGNLGGASGTGSGGDSNEGLGDGDAVSAGNTAAGGRGGGPAGSPGYGHSTVGGAAQAGRGPGAGGSGGGSGSVGGGAAGAAQGGVVIVRARR